MGNPLCPVKDCPRRIHGVLPTCFYHWRAAPPDLRTSVIRHYTSGMCQTKGFQEACESLVGYFVKEETDATTD